MIGSHIPVWDIRDEFGDTNMLVRTMEMGRSLARTLDQNTCILMAGHGAVVVGETVQLAVKAAVYLQVNARVLSEALRLGEPRQFTDREIELSAAMENPRLPRSEPGSISASAPVSSRSRTCVVRAI